MSHALLKPFGDALNELEKSLKVAKKHKISLASHAFYSRKVRSTLAELWKAFLSLKKKNPPDQHPGVAYQLATIEPMVQRLVAMYPTEPNQMLPVVQDIQFKAEERGRHNAPEDPRNLDHRGLQHQEHQREDH